MTDLWQRFEPHLTSKWAIALYAIAGAVVLARLLLRVLRPAILLVTSRTHATWDDKLAEALSGPLAIVLAIQVFRVSLPWLALDPRALPLLRDAAAVATAMALLWFLFRTVDLVSAGVAKRAWAQAHPASRSLISLGGRFSKVTLLVLGVVIVLAQLGVSVASLIAGLGIGGLAVALAAQKTVENLFGAVSIGVDQPMREGDYVTVGTLSGTVERIGLRSTRIRTPDRTLVTIPNGELANQRIETFAARDRIRLFTTLRIVKPLAADRLRALLGELEATLRRQPKVVTEGATIRFVGISDSAFDVEVFAYFDTASWDEYQLLRQAFLLELLEVVERTGAALAHPTRDVRSADAGARAAR